MAHLSVIGRQFAAARVLVEKSQKEIAESSGISVPTLKRMEACSGPVVGIPNNVRAVIESLSLLGIEFINDENAIGVVLRPSNIRE